MKNISKENGGKISLNDVENKYLFRKAKNMFEGISQKNINESDNKIEEQNKIIIEEINKK